MARQVNQVLWTQWRQRMERQRTSGLPIVKFCRMEGVSSASFHAWKRKLRNSASVRQSMQKASPTRRVRRRAAAGSVRHEPQGQPARSPAPVADFLQLPIHGMRSNPWIELSLVNGTLVRIPQENLVALTTLLRVLRGDDRNGSSGEARYA